MNQIFKKTIAVLYLNFIFISYLIAGTRVEMKVVDEPTNLGMNFPYQQEETNEPTLKMRVTPSNFSGPPHLKVLFGKCFTKIHDEYRYELCPFVNVTQHEQSLRWNPYSGVLGVWQGWVIENNTYVAMEMLEGDSCGDKYRSIKVELKCGNSTSIGRVTEPNTCQYHMIFNTPLVCHPHALLVYPTLSPEMRYKWDVLKSRYENEEYTQQGYRKQLRHLFAEAGLMLEDSKRQQLSEEAKNKETENNADNKIEFDSLDTCSAEYKKLKEELESLKALKSVNRNNTEAIQQESDVS